MKLLCFEGEKTLYVERCLSKRNRMKLYTLNVLRNSDVYLEVLYCTVQEWGRAGVLSFSKCMSFHVGGGFHNGKFVGA